MHSESPTPPNQHLLGEEMKNSLSELDFFSAKLAYEITPGALLCDNLADCDPGLLPDEDADIVVYSWGSDDQGGTRAAVALLQLGYSQVRELVGGFSAWEDAGLDVESDPGQVRHLVTPIGAPKAG